jgi:hypothetical protein
MAFALDAGQSPSMTMRVGCAAHAPARLAALADSGNDLIAGALLGGMIQAVQRVGTPVVSELQLLRRRLSATL